MSKFASAVGILAMALVFFGAGHGYGWRAGRRDMHRALKPQLELLLELRQATRHEDCRLERAQLEPTVIVHRSQETAWYTRALVEGPDGRMRRVDFDAAPICAVY
jgi:hypothetical protein